jgi:hypothetical protein
MYTASIYATTISFSHFLICKKYITFGFTADLTGNTPRQLLASMYFQKYASTPSGFFSPKVSPFPSLLVVTLVNFLTVVIFVISINYSTL